MGKGHLNFGKVALLIAGMLGYTIREYGSRTGTVEIVMFETVCF